MHPDLVKLVELQAKDAEVAAREQRLANLSGETADLDEALKRARELLEKARQTATDGQRRRDELETKIESYRILQDRRRLRLEQVRNPKDATTLMTELDLAQSVMAKEENDWVRSADMVIQLEVKVRDAERHLEAVVAAQAPERAEVAKRQAVLEAERDTALREREASAAELDKPIRARYDRLRRTRSSDVIVPLVGGACGSCHTAVPMNRRSLIRAGQVVDACEACGAILYPSEPAGSARRAVHGVHCHDERLSRPNAPLGNRPGAGSRAGRGPGRRSSASTRAGRPPGAARSWVRSRGTQLSPAGTGRPVRSARARRND